MHDELPMTLSAIAWLSDAPSEAGATPTPSPILTISPRKNETPKLPKRRDAETPNHDHPCHAHAFGWGA